MLTGKLSGGIGGAALGVTLVNAFTGASEDKATPEDTATHDVDNASGAPTLGDTFNQASLQHVADTTNVDLNTVQRISAEFIKHTQDLHTKTEITSEFLSEFSESVAGKGEVNITAEQVQDVTKELYSLTPVNF